MKIEIDFDEALDEFVAECKQQYYSKVTVQEQAERCFKLLDILSSYEQIAEAIALIVETVAPVVKQQVINLLDFAEGKTE